jgi:glycosyltransferase involved in cell wall biosynthesis
MKVLMTADTVGGVWHYAMELIRALGPHDVEVVLATMGAPPDADQHRQASQLPDLQLCAGDFKLEWMSFPWQDVAAAGDWLLKLEAQHHPDVIHLNGYAHGVLPWRAPLLVVGHSCVLSWWRAVRGSDAPAAWDEYRCQIAAGLRAADLVVSPSREMLDSLLRHYGPLPRSRVIHNARGPDLFRPAQKEPFILSAGRLWDEAKNLHALESFAASLPWPVYVAGESRGPDGATACTSGIHLLGRLTTAALSQWLGRAAVLAHPARYEPFGLAVLEAALSGCALVLGDIASLREIWGDAAVYVDPADPEAIEAGIRSLIDQPTQRALLAYQALARAQTYAPASMAGEYVAAYRELVARRAAPPSREMEEPSCAS